MARAGTLDAFEVPEREMLWQVATLARPRRIAGAEQLPLPLDPAAAPPLPAPDRIDRVIAEYETTGVSTGWHLMTLIRPALPKGTITAQALKNTRHGTAVIVARKNSVRNQVSAGVDSVCPISSWAISSRERRRLSLMSCSGGRAPKSMDQKMK